MWIEPFARNQVSRTIHFIQHFGVFLKILFIYFISLETRPKLDEMEGNMKILQKFRVLHRMFQYSFQSYLLPVQYGVAACAAICGTFGVLRMTGPRAIVMGVVAIFAISYLYSVFRGMGLLYEESFALKTLWLKLSREKSSRAKYFRKEIQAKQEFRIEVGSFFFIKRSTIMTLVNGIVNFTANLLLTRLSKL